MECSVTISLFNLGQTIIKRNKTFLRKTQSQWDVVWIYFEHKFFPLILNDNENSSLYCKQSQQHSQKPKKLCFQLENKEKSMGPTFSEEVVNRGRCFSSCHKRGTNEKNLTPYEESNHVETQNFFLCPMFVTRRKTSSSISLPSSKLTTSGLLYLRSNQCLQVT